MLSGTLPIVGYSIEQCELDAIASSAPQDEPHLTSKSSQHILHCSDILWLEDEQKPLLRERTLLQVAAPRELDEAAARGGRAMGAPSENCAEPRIAAELRPNIARARACT